MGGEELDSEGELGDEADLDFGAELGAEEELDAIGELGDEEGLDFGAELGVKMNSISQMSRTKRVLISALAGW